MQNLKKALTAAIMGIALFPLMNHAQPLFTNLITTLTMTFEQAQNLATPVLPLGGSYFFRATGRYGVGPGDRGEAMHDAAWATVITSTLDQTHNPNYGWQWNGTSTNRPSPDVYQSNHVYNFYFAGRGAAEVLTFTDTVYSDNVGTLTFQLYEITQDPFKNGLVAYYPFNGNANDAIGTNNGTVFGATLTPNRFGETNRAYYFDGQSKIVAGDQSIPLGNASRTFSLWVNCHTVATNKHYAIPFKYGNLSPSHGNWINVFTGDDGTGRPARSVLFDFYNSGVLSSNLIALDTWQHLVCAVSSPSSARIYINGRLAGAGSVAANTTSSGTMLIGSYDAPDASAAGVIGEIDDVRIYNRALSASEVQQLYDYESGPRVGFIKAVKPSFSNLTLTTNYQLQVSGDMNTWTNHGSAFTATNTSMVHPQYWDVDNWGNLFFRLQVIP